MNDEVNELVPRLYEALRGQALRYAAQHGGSMHPSSVVQEVWIKLSRAETLSFRSEAHFSAVAARAMRQVLADRARLRGRAKRGGGLERVALDNLGAEPALVDTVAIETALSRLEAARPRAAQIVELRVFGGLTLEEMGEVLQLSAGTIKREWRVARAFLIDALS
ncbi:MAG: sigma-70 family RNA polymerase sigma factor [Myxococcales bacterium]|nr:sigma-70 family RNA polymerase sigma factor [Myxococcales bacterium]